MKPFGESLTLAKNSRGCYILDTVKGCSVANSRVGGCYGECYAANIAKRYRLDFGAPVLRRIQDGKHRTSLIRKMQKAPTKFIRIGEMGDPSEDWAHTLSIAPLVREAGKACVIITKHWKPVPEELLPLLAGIYVNTSTSALDSDGERAYRLAQYERLKPWCNSVLRVVSCKFNRETEEGRARNQIQVELLSRGAIDTVFRPGPGNEFLTRGAILVEPRKFLGTKMLASVNDESVHFGRCGDCPDLCGLNPPKPRA